ncbi:MAG: PspA-associated protein PspAB [Gaiellaceae bacterium]
MGLRDALLGRKGLKKAKRDALFALPAAAVTMDAELGLRPAGVAAVVFKPLSAGEFVRAENEMQELLDVAARDSSSKVERSTDSYGYEWLVVRDNDFEDLVTTVNLVASELASRGFGEQLLAAPFKFEGGKHPVLWIYGFKRGAFWPFVPTGEGQERDNPEELELKAKLERELPIESELSRWFGLFGAPL